MKKSYLVITGIILASFIISIYFYPQMPDRIASHWNAQGQVDGYMPKFWALFLMPFISVVLFLLFLVIPKIDPLKSNIEKFRKYYDTFIVLIMVFLFYLHILTILWNVGVRFNLIQVLSPAFGILFYYAGILVQHTKRNWFIGIRTPWTLSNEKVWEKTHKVGGKLFKAAGVIAFLGIIVPKYAIWVMVIPVIVVAVYTVVYSYVEYKKIEKKN